MSQSPNGHLQSLDKGLQVLELLAAHHRGLSLREIAGRLGFNLSSTHHLAATLRQRGFVDQDPETKAYRLGYGLVSLVNDFLSDATISSVGIGPIRELRDRTGDTSFLTILQGREIFVVFEAQGRYPIQTKRTRSSFEPHLHAYASGKTLLAYLPPEQVAEHCPTGALTKYTPNTIGALDGLRVELAAIRAQGYALDQEEWLVGLDGVGAPVFDRHGVCVATASVAYPAVQRERQAALINEVVGTARQISASLGFVFRPDSRDSSLSAAPADLVPPLASAAGGNRDESLDAATLAGDPRVRRESPERRSVRDE